MATISHSSNDRTNFPRLYRLLIDGGTQVLRDIFDSIHPQKTLHKVLHCTKIHAKLKTLMAKRILNTQQWQKLYPTVLGTVTSENFDITLLFVLLRNICGLSPPPTGWDCLPLTTDKTLVADLVRIKYYRNNLFAHISNTFMDDKSFEGYWSDIEDCLVRLGGPVCSNQIQRLKFEPIDAADEEYFLKNLKDWEDSERELKVTLKDTGDRVLEKITEVQDRIEEKLDQAEFRLGDKLKDMLKVDNDVLSDGPKQSGLSTNVSTYNVMVSGQAQVAIGEKAAITSANFTGNPYQMDYKEKSFSVADRSSLLKASSRSRTEFQHKLVASHMLPNVKTDDIFTNLVIQHGRKPLGQEDLNKSRREQLNWYSKVQGIPVKRCEEIFTVNDDGSNANNYILVIGKPGIGKSIFCEKLTRDWACDRLFQEPVSSGQTRSFSFVYLLYFRQLNSLDCEDFTLQDVLNRSTLLDERSVIDDKLFNHLACHPEDLLIIIDGFDEFKNREEVVGDFEEKFPNDPQFRMPVSALCSKLVKGKLLRGMTLLITSRPAEADELGDVYFHEYAEITGFSPLQVQEYIEKYFKNDENVKKAVLNHIMANETLVSFAHIPILCRLMCWYIEWHLRNKTPVDLPLTITDLFTDVIQIYLQKHHSELKYSKTSTDAQTLVKFFKRSDGTKSASCRWKNTLEKLSTLAASLLLEKKMTFTVKDMESSGLREDEIVNLKESGLLYCSPCCPSTDLGVMLSFCFTHLTVQEFFTANWFYKEKKMPSLGMASGMVLQFVAGLAARDNDSKFLERIVKWIAKLKHRRRDEKQLLTTKCLYEFKDFSVAKYMVKTYYSRCFEERHIVFLDVSDVDCGIISFLLDILTSFKESATSTRRSVIPNKHQQESVTESDSVYHLYIGMSTISSFGVRRICNSLMKEMCPITELILFDCGITDDSVQSIANLLLKNKLRLLGMGVNHLTDKGFVVIHKALTAETCSLEKLFLSYNEISDTSANKLVESLVNRACGLTTVKVNNNEKITDTCRESVKQIVKKHRPDVDLLI